MMESRAGLKSELRHLQSSWNSVDSSHLEGWDDEHLADKQLRELQPWILPLAICSQDAMLPSRSHKLGHSSRSFAKIFQYYKLKFSAWAVNGRQLNDNNFTWNYLLMSASAGKTDDKIHGMKTVLQLLKLFSKYDTFAQPLSSASSSRNVHGGAMIFDITCAAWW